MEHHNHYHLIITVNFVHFDIALPMTDKELRKIKEEFRVNDVFCLKGVYFDFRGVYCLKGVYIVLS